MPSAICHPRASFHRACDVSPCCHLLCSFWPLVVVPIGIMEVFSVFSFNSPIGGGEMWSIRSDYDNGDLGFDPMGLRPETAEEFKEMQTKELNNGRLAMIAIAGTCHAIRPCAAPIGPE